MLDLFIGLYPSFMRYMGATFKQFMPIYALVFVGESLMLILYYYSWDRMMKPGLKWGHATIGIVCNVFGTSLLLLANAWAAFMMAPAGSMPKAAIWGMPGICSIPPCGIL